jgi:hypothetical protein
VGSAGRFKWAWCWELSYGWSCPSLRFLPNHLELRNEFNDLLEYLPAKKCPPWRPADAIPDPASLPADPNPYGGRGRAAAIRPLLAPSVAVALALQHALCSATLSSHPFRQAAHLSRRMILGISALRCLWDWLPWAYDTSSYNVLSTSACGIQAADRETASWKNSSLPLFLGWYRHRSIADTIRHR